MLSLNDYLQDPCRASSLPWWKTLSTAIPDGVLILHDAEFEPSLPGRFEDEPYFRLLHTLEHLEKPALPDGYALRPATLQELAAHIDFCYGGIGFTADTLRAYIGRKVYDPTLWLTVVDLRTGMIAASGIGEVDCEVREGALEWIQVSPDHQRRGLGRFIVLELLSRMRGKASFATVSGKCRNASRPDALYRSCGFQGNDIWHVLHRRER